MTLNTLNLDYIMLAAVLLILALLMAGCLK